MDLFGCLLASGERSRKGFLLTCLGASLAAGVPWVGLLFDTFRVKGGFAKSRDRVVWAPVWGLFLTCLGASLRAVSPWVGLPPV